jgi:peptidoglycan/LPS O-acetylase OafA/YrhL
MGAMAIWRIDVAILALALGKHVLRWKDNSTITTVGLSVIAIAAASLIACTQAYPRVREVLLADWLRFLGRYSYGIYMLHFVAYVALYRWVARQIIPIVHNRIAASIIGVLTIQLLTLVAAVSSFRFYESPFLRLKRHFENRQPALQPELR